MDGVLHRARYTLRERAGNLCGAATERAVWRVRARPLGDASGFRFLSLDLLIEPIDALPLDGAIFGDESGPGAFEMSLSWGCLGPCFSYP